MAEIPTVFVPRRPYTDRTFVAIPLIYTALRGLAVYGIEWTTLDFIEHAPVMVRVVTFVVASAILGALQWKSWLDFKGRFYFRSVVIVLSILYIGITSWSFISFEKPLQQTSVISAVGQIPPHTAQPSQPAVLSVDEIQFRTDLRKYIRGALYEQVNAFSQMASHLSVIDSNTHLYKDKETTEEADDLFHFALNSDFNKSWVALYSALGVPIEKIDYKNLVPLYRQFIEDYNNITLLFRDFLLLSGQDPNQSSFLSKLFEAEQRSKNTYLDLVSSPVAETAGIAHLGNPSSGDRFAKWQGK